MELGEKIKELRLQCDLTQEELAARCELSKGYISQLENDLTSPSIATLTDILTALGSSLREFFAVVDADEKVVFSEQDFNEKVTENEIFSWLVPNAQKNLMEPVRVVLKPHSKTEEDVPHEGEEFGYVIEGEIVLCLGKKRYPVKKGESFYFEAGKVHHIENCADFKAVVIWVSSPPTF